MKAQRTRNTLLFIAGIAALVTSIGSANAQTLGEALGATNLVWTTGGNVPWFVETTNTHNGDPAAAQSGIVLSNQTSWLQTTVVGPATISFWGYAQMEVSNQLGLEWGFTVNNPPPPYFGIPIQQPGSAIPWQEYTYDLGTGTNVLQWTTYGRYAGSETCFLDIDDISISPPRPLSILYQPNYYLSSNYAGASIFLSVTAIGTPPFQYQWYVNGTNILGATNALFHLTQTTTNDTGVYTVLVTNSQGSVLSSNAIVTILPASAPFFILEPADTVVYTEQSFNWSANFAGSPPFYLQWTKDGTNLPGATGQWLSLPNVSLADVGTYTLIVSNSLGIVESTNAALTVIQSVAPVFTNQPHSLDVAEGVSTWMKAAVSAVPNPDIIWANANTPPVVQPPGLVPPFLSSQLSTYYFDNVTATNAGVYYAVADNYAGQAVSQEALLNVLPPITNVATWNQDAIGIFVTNGLAFLARGTNGLSILSVTNPASPQLLSTLTTTGYFAKVAISGGAAIVADELNGVQIISVTNPASPVFLACFPGMVYDLAINSNFVYAAAPNSGLLVLDISNLQSPVLVGSCVSNFVAESICRSGNYVYVGSTYEVLRPSANGIVTIDVTDPAHPVEISQLSLPASSLVAEGQNVYDVYGNNFPGSGGLQVISETNPAQPSLIGQFNYYGSIFSENLVTASSVSVLSHLAFMVGNQQSQSQFYVVDVDDPTQPIPVGYYTDSSLPTTLAMAGNLAFVAGPGSPLEILATPFDTSPVAAPTLSLATQAGFNLSIQGHHGRHYDVQYSDQLTGGSWQTLETLLLTNDAAVITPPSGPATRFFRLKQDD